MSAATRKDDPPAFLELCIGTPPISYGRDMEGGGNPALEKGTMTNAGSQGADDRRLRNARVDMPDVHCLSCDCETKEQCLATHACLDCYPGGCRE